MTEGRERRRAGRERGRTARWSGPAGHLPADVERALRRVCETVEGADRGWLVAGSLVHDSSALADALYVAWYTRASTPASTGGPAPLAADPIVVVSSLAPALRAAHAAAGTLLDGWVAVSVTPRGSLVAGDGTARRSVHPGEYVDLVRPGVPPAPGEPVRIVARLDHLDAERGLWWTFSEPGLDDLDGRVYLDVRAATAPRALHVVTRLLAEAGIAYQLKCPVDPSACDRVDSVVLYHRRTARRSLLAALATCARELAPLLDADVPPLTRRIGHGLAWADDPGGQRSFGQSRCEALASAIARSGAEWNAAGTDARLDVLCAGLRSAGIDPRRPWRVGT